MIVFFSSHAVTSDLSLQEQAKAAEFFHSDGIIITGTSTGEPIHLDDLTAAKESVSLPVIIGSGVNGDNVHLYKNADGLIIGSHFKTNGKWYHDIDEKRVAKFMNLITRVPGNAIVLLISKYGHIIGKYDVNI